MTAHAPGTGTSGYAWVHRRDFYWSQVKEKFGSARFYYRLGTSRRLVVDVSDGEGGHALIKKATKEGDSVADRIDAIVDQAEAKTCMACMACMVRGAPAETKPYDGYYLTVCAAHAPVGRAHRSGEL